MIKEIVENDVITFNRSPPLTGLVCFEKYDFLSIISSHSSGVWKDQDVEN